MDAECILVIAKEAVELCKNESSYGFAFLKVPLFFADSIFLKSPERIESLSMIMGLCLLVYTLAQRQIRTTLRESKSTIKNQLVLVFAKVIIPISLVK